MGQLRKQFLVPGLIIMTFIGLYLVPLLIIRFVCRPTGDSVTISDAVKHECLSILTDIDTTSDAIIYIFLTKRYRSVLLEHFSCKCKNNGKRNEVVEYHKTNGSNHDDTSHILLSSTE